MNLEVLRVEIAKLEMKPGDKLLVKLIPPEGKVPYGEIRNLVSDIAGEVAKCVGEGNSLVIWGNLEFTKVETKEIEGATWYAIDNNQPKERVEKLFTVEKE